MQNNRLLRLTLILLTLSWVVTGSVHAADTPRDLRGTEIRQDTVKWEWREVSDAVRYEVTVNGRYQGDTRDTRFYSYGLSAGEHRMYVKAVGSDGSVSAPTRTASIKVSDVFRNGAHGRSVLLPASPGSASAVPRNTRGTEIAAGTMKWEWDAVAGAVEYQVTVDGEYVGKTRSTSWESRDLWPGEHSMTVKSVSSNGVLSAQSDNLKVVVTGRAGGGTSPTAGSPSGLVTGLRSTEYSGGDVLWQWSSYPGAVEYEATVDGKVVGKTAGTQWTSRGLWSGEHSLTVRAILSNSSKTSQSDTLKIWVSGNASGSVPGAPNAVAPPPPVVEKTDVVAQPAPPPPVTTGGGDENAADVQSLIDPASYNYPEVTAKAGYELVFSDEFNGTALNPYRWHSQLRWDGEWNGERYEYRIVNGEDQFYVNVLSPDEEHQREIVPVYNPFQFNGNRLAIRAALNPLKSRDRTTTHGKLDTIVPQQPFLSGAISTHEKFAQKFGYFEARIKIPDHVGTFPAFWLFHERRAWEGTRRTEIDIMENLGHAPHYIYNSFHYFTNVTRTYGGDANFIKPSPSGQIRGEDFSNDYYVYAVEWTPGNVKWLVNGEVVSELSNGNVNYEELYVMINLAMGGNWTNFPTNAGGLGRPGDQRYPTAEDIRNFSNPALEIDYVRVYKRK